MKFECSKCGKKYSLPDEKVPAGKDFKVKCKKCGEVIIIHASTSTSTSFPEKMSPFQQVASSYGDTNRPLDEEPTRVFDYSKADPALMQAYQYPAPSSEVAPPAQESIEPEWHVAIDGQQMGPYTKQQLIDMLSGGQIDNETYVWKDGFEDWVPLKEVEELNMVSQQSYSPEPAPQIPETPSTKPFAEKVSPITQSPFFASKPATHDLFSPRQPDEVESPPFESPGQEVVTSSPVVPMSPRVDASRLKGARHEDSVLFSLASLQSLASSSKQPAKSFSAGPSEGGSGLIDIRSLAGSAGTSSGTSVKTEDIFNIGGGGFGQPLGIPSLLQPPEKRTSVLYYILGGVGGFAILTLIVLIIGIFGFGWGRTKTVHQETTKPVLNEEELKAKLLAELQKSGLAQQTAQGQVLASASQELSSAEKTEESAATSDETKKKKGGGKKKTGMENEESSSSQSKDALSLPKEEGTKTGSKSGDSLLDLIDAATSKKDKKSTTKTPADSGETKSSSSAGSSSSSSADMPATPSKSDVLAAMKSVTPKVQACAKGQTGKAITSIVFSGATGKATSATVIGGEFQGTPAASCIANAVKSASVPKFKQASFSVTYPFVIK